MAEKPQGPLVLTLAERDLEMAFKPVLKEIVKGKNVRRTKISNTSISMDVQVRKDLVRGFQDIDFESNTNSRALDDLVDDIWSKFKSDFLLYLKKHNRDFKKKST